MMASSSFWSSFGALLSSLNPSISLSPPLPGSDADTAFWFVPPDRTAVDLVAGVAYFSALAVLLARGPSVWRVELGALPPRAARRVGLFSSALGLAEFALTAAAWLCALGVLHFKRLHGQLVYVLMPCHMTTFILCAASLVLLLPPPTAASPPCRWRRFAARALHLTVGASWGTVSALLWPDVSGARRATFLEAEHFFVQHWVLLLLPTVWILRRRFDVYGGLRAEATAYAGLGLYQFALLLPASILSGLNLNYMMMPPHTVPYPAAILRLHLYRGATTIAGAVATIAHRRLLVAPVVALAVALARAHGEELGASAGGDGDGAAPAPAEQEKKRRRTLPAGGAAKASGGAARTRSPRRRRSSARA